MGEDEAGTAKIVRERREAATPNAHVEASKFFRSSTLWAEGSNPIRLSWSVIPVTAR
jgi:hypothetical protein